MITEKNDIIIETYPLLKELIWITKYTCSGRNILINDNELFYWLETKKSEPDNLDLTSNYIIEDKINHN